MILEPMEVDPDSFESSQSSWLDLLFAIFSMILELMEVDLDTFESSQSSWLDPTFCNISMILDSMEVDLASFEASQPSWESAATSSLESTCGGVAEVPCVPAAGCR